MAVGPDLTALGNDPLWANLQEMPVETTACVHVFALARGDIHPPKLFNEGDLVWISPEVDKDCRFYNTPCHKMGESSDGVSMLMGVAGKYQPELLREDGVLLVAVIVQGMCNVQTAAVSPHRPALDSTPGDTITFIPPAPHPHNTTNSAHHVNLTATMLVPDVHFCQIYLQ
jgi:hypothetical protein